VRKEKSWEDEPGKCFIDIEIDFESTGYSIDTNYMAHPDFQRPPEGKDDRTIITARIEGLDIPQKELDYIQAGCSTVWEAFFKIIGESKLKRDE